MRSSLLAERALILALIGACTTACPSEETPDAGSGVNADATPTDLGGGGNPDAADAGSLDVPEGMDVESTDLPPRDSGIALRIEMAVGAFVTVPDGKIDLTTDTFLSVRGKLGDGTRSATANTRSYEWSYGDGTQLTIWFANSNLDNDDAPPNDVDNTDQVLWIAVSGTYAGRTQEAIGIGSTQAQVETAYGVAPHTVPLTAPAGVLAQYLTTGLLAAYDASGNVRTVTICRKYQVEPDGSIDVPNGRLDFAGRGQIAGFRAAAMVGTEEINVRNMLGAPDAEGQVTIGGLGFRLLSYSFTGMEVFVSPATSRTSFISIHPPYYGTLLGSAAGLGSTRAQIEAALNLGMGGVSPSSPSLICYPEGPNSVDVIVGYSSTADEATLINIPAPLRMCR